MAVAQLEQPLLGRGIYDVAEIARLVHRSVHEVSGWARGSLDQTLLWPRGAGLFSFYDLVTAHVTAEMLSRGAALSGIRNARAHLAPTYRSDWPLAHAASLKHLASSGRDVYAWVGPQVVDAGRGGQLPFLDIVRPLLRSLDFDPAEMASSWRPAPDVLIDPNVQAGAPCVFGTRVTTQLLSELAAQGEQLDDLAADFNIPLDVLERAVTFEHELAA